MLTHKAEITPRLPMRTGTLYAKLFLAASASVCSAMSQREQDEGASGKIILFVVFGVFPVLFMLLVFFFGPMLGLQFGA
jgi:hypothetical protein